MKTFIFKVTIKNDNFGRLTRKCILKADDYHSASNKLRDTMKQLFWEVEHIDDISNDYFVF